MKIGVNVQILNDSSTGVARYAENMLRALVRQQDSHSLIVYGARQHSIPLSDRVKTVPTSSLVRGAARRILWEQFVLSHKVKRERVDVIYYPDHTGPLVSKPCRVVLTVHDLAFLAMPETHGVGRRLYKSLTIKRSLARADMITTVSRATYEECLKYLRIPETKMVVIHNGVDDRMRKEFDPSRLASAEIQLRLRKPFILFVGTLERRKNLTRLIEAFAQLKKKAEIPHQLVLAGAPGFGYGEIVNAIKATGIAGDIIMTGFIGDDQLPALYSLADVMVYPSLYEGFGFPPLEAMACGCPVVVSNVTSLPEIVGEAGLLVDPLNTGALAEAIHRVVSETGLRQDLVARGLAQTKRFSWDDAAKRLVTVFESLM